MEGVLSQKVLVLNRLWQAVNIITVRRACGLLFRDHAKVLQASEDNFLIYPFQDWVLYSKENPPQSTEESIGTVNTQLHPPRIILLNNYSRLPMKEVNFTRQRLFERDNYTCQYCNQAFSEKDLNLDHVVPREKGGQTSWENIVTSCLPCNARKGNRSPKEAGMALRKKPHRPKARPLVSFALSSEKNDVSWKYFLFN